MDQSAIVWEVLRQYGYEDAYMENAGDVVYLAVPEGEYALKRSSAPREKLILLHHLLDRAIQSGCDHLLPWVKTKQGDPIVEIRGTCWYLVPWKRQSTQEGKRWSSTEGMAALARLHQATEPGCKELTELAPSIKQKEIEVWKQKLEKLEQYAEQGKGREFASPFDRAFVSSKDQLVRSFQFAIRGLERYRESEDGAVPRAVLCHTRLHPSNVVQDGEQLYWIDFDHAQVDTPVRDVALAIQRFSLYDGESPFALLEAYEREWKLEPKEKRLLALYLSYPERILKTLGRYYDQPRTATVEPQFTKRFEREIGQFEQIQELVKSLWPSKKKQEEGEKAQVATGQPGRKKKRKKNHRHS
ncbi:phosphotransferase [Laceyella putida]|uniref:Phosphotransferase n=1 Tax=Laceyella putida TaxID=110101 RepID=A0ABW2RIQ3_9BACL